MSSKNPTIHDKIVSNFDFVFDYYKKPLSFQTDSVYQSFISPVKWSIMYLSIPRKEAEPVVLYNNPDIQYISTKNPPLKPIVILFMSKHAGK